MNLQHGRGHAPQAMTKTPPEWLRYGGFHSSFPSHGLVRDLAWILATLGHLHRFVKAWPVFGGGNLFRRSFNSSQPQLTSCCWSVSGASSRYFKGPCKQKAYNQAMAHASSKEVSVPPCFAGFLARSAAKEHADESEDEEGEDEVVDAAVPVDA